MKALAKLLLILVLATLACNNTPERKLNLYPSPTVLAKTSTPIIVEVTRQVQVEITVTPEPTSVGKSLCVTAKETVYLRTQPDMAHDIVQVLANGEKIEDTGTRKGDWYFVRVGKNTGWVNSAYLKGCE